MAPAEWIADGTFDLVRDETARVVQLVSAIQDRMVAA